MRYFHTNRRRIVKVMHVQHEKKEREGKQTKLKRKKKKKMTTSKKIQNKLYVHCSIEWLSVFGYCLFHSKSTHTYFMRWNYEIHPTWWSYTRCNACFIIHRENMSNLVNKKETKQLLYIHTGTGEKKNAMTNVYSCIQNSKKSDWISMKNYNHDVCLCVWVFLLLRDAVKMVVPSKSGHHH